MFKSNARVLTEVYFKQLLCDVTEYNEMPVRHNEDKLNEELAINLPIRVPAYSYDSPHTKVYSTCTDVNYTSCRRGRHHFFVHCQFRTNILMKKHGQK